MYPVERPYMNGAKLIIMLIFFTGRTSNKNPPKDTKLPNIDKQIIYSNLKSEIRASNQILCLLETWS